MITKKRMTSSSILMSLVFLLLLSLNEASTDHCSISKPSETIGLLSTQSLSLTLGDYVRGYNLKFSSDNPLNARVSNPLNSVGSVEFAFKEGYNLVNSDILQTNDKRWLHPSVVFAQKDSKSIGLALTELKGTRNIQQQIQHQYYTLDTQANCFSAKIIDSSSNVVLDCQTVDPTNIQDMICLVDTKEKTLRSCLKIDSLNQVKDRKSQVLFLGNEIFLLSASYSREQNSQDMTYITIYRVILSTGSIQFVNIIDGYQLGLDYQIIISDFDILSNGNIVIHDLVMSQILFVEYTLSNQIQLVKKPWVYGSQGVEIEVSGVNTILIATRTYVEEWDLTIRLRVFRYELDKTDNQVISLSVSPYNVVVETSRNTLYIYQRIMSPLNYVLGTLVVRNKDYLLSPYSNVLYIFDQKQYDIYQLGSGTISLSSLDKSQNITITATSLTAQCKFTLSIVSLESTDKIIMKQNITSKQFIAENDNVLNINLEDAFSGQNLRYQVPQSTPEVKFELEHLTQYTVDSQLNLFKLKQVVTLNKTSYLLLGLWENLACLEMCVSNDTQQKITCKIIHSSTVISKNPILLTGRQRKSGQVVFVWTYEETKFAILSYNDGKVAIGYTFDGIQYEYSSVVIAEDRIFFVLKQYAMIEIMMDLQKSFRLLRLDAKSVNPTTEQIVGFYPRELYLHPRSSQLFYVKFPMHVCLMTLIQDKLQIVDCQKVIDRIISDQQWTVVIGLSTYVVITPQTISQYTILGNNATLLHTITIQSPIVYPIYYNLFLNTAVLRTQNNKVIYYKLNKPVIDCLYYEMVVLENGEQTNGDFLSSQGYWTLAGTGTKAYRQSLNTRLAIELVGDSKSFMEDINVTIVVQGKQDRIQVDDNITIVKYPTLINQNNTTNSAYQLPKTGSQTRIPINVTEYFTGPLANYHIVCDYCDDTIQLQTLFRNKTSVDGIIGDVRSIVEVFDKMSVVLTTKNNLYLLDAERNVIVSNKIENVKSCQKMAWQLTMGLVVLCADNDGQEILLFKLNSTSINQTTGSYPIHAQATITNVDQMFLITKQSSSLWLLIQDNDISQQSLSKTANIKVFILSPQTLQYKGVIDAKSFDIVQSSQPINDVEIVGDEGMIVVTIGNVGLGYGWLDEKSNEVVLANAQVVNLKQVSEVHAYVLDNSIFQQVRVQLTTTSMIKIMITSSTSIPMVLSFNLLNNKLQSPTLIETYNRYGQLPTINWHAATQDILLLGYYNSDTFEEYVVMYNRTEAGKLVDFSESISRKISQRQLSQNDVYLTSAGVLLLSEPSNANSLSSYVIAQSFDLLLSYQQPSDFTAITFSASNIYSSSHVDLPVEFQRGPNDDSGVKWYTIMIIALIVLIICGVAYGMYLKMMKNRKDKKVSLLTEGEEVDEQI